MIELHPEVEAIRAVITDRNISSAAVAKATSIKSDHFDKLMSGEVDMTMDEEDEMCQFLGINIIVLAGMGEMIKLLRKSKTPGHNSGQNDV